MNTKFRFTFKPADAANRTLIHKWIAQKHIKEWLHGLGLKNTLESLDKFLNGDTYIRHWIAYDKEQPFGYLMTSEVAKTSPEDHDIAQWCQEEGVAITLDLFICDLEYLGKGLSVQMIQEFLITQFPNVTEIFIDPEASNTRAVHVYEKAGFQILEEFIAKWHPVSHYRMKLNMKEFIHRFQSQKDMP